MSGVTDLDVHVPENKQVKLGGREYTLPGDLPMEMFLRLNAAQAKSDDDEPDGVEAINTLLTVIGDLFAWVAPEDLKQSIRDEVQRVLRGRGVRFLMTMIRNIYNEDEADEEKVLEGNGDEVPPPPSPEAGTPSTTS